jgi:hypothetical protein
MSKAIHFMTVFRTQEGITSKTSKSIAAKTQGLPTFDLLIWRLSVTGRLGVEWVAGMA